MLLLLFENAADQIHLVLRGLSDLLGVRKDNDRLDAEFVT